LQNKTIDNYHLEARLQMKCHRNRYASIRLATWSGRLAKMGKRVENAFFLQGRADVLVGSCDVFVSLNKEMLKDCLRKKAAPTTGGGKV